MIIVGLGNPEQRYAGTRHNVGRAAVLRLAERHGLEFPRRLRFNGYVTEGLVAGSRCILALPETFMNRSGDCVGPMAGFYKVPATEVVVVHDELDLPLGAVRLKQDGGHGGHNGLRDIERALGRRDYIRVRIGVGRPPAQMDTADYVLQRFAGDEQGAVAEAVVQACDAVEAVLREGLPSAMNRLNRRESNKEPEAAPSKRRDETNVNVRKSERVALVEQKETT